MIYKFNSNKVELEIELDKSEDRQEYCDYITFSIKHCDRDGYVIKSLKKEEIYDLIKALQVLYKKMD